MKQNLASDLNEVIHPHALLESQFYQAWSAGTLSEKGLADYANDYGAFITLLPLGWGVQSDQETAHEEEEHIELWERFARSLGTEIDGPISPAVVRLCESAQALFADRASALGALYAFEVQQPDTSVSKLKGLRDHYGHLKADEAYFEAHSNNHHEAQKLLERIAALSEPDRAKAMAAAEKMARGLREALDGLYHESGSACFC